MRKIIDWERVELDYRAGILSLREIGEACDVSPAMILKRAKKYAWERDLAARIMAKAEAEVNKATVNAQVNAEHKAFTEKLAVEVNGLAVAQIILKHRNLAARSIALSERLTLVLEGMEVEEGNAREYAAVLKQLADAQRTLVGIEAEAWNLAKNQPAETPAPQQIDRIEGARRVAFALTRAAVQTESTVH